MPGYVIWVAILLGLVGLVLFLRHRYPAGSTGRRVIVWTGWAVAIAAFGLFMNYWMPSHEVVRVTNTFNRITTVSWENAWAYASPDTGTAESTVTRDIRFIETAHTDDTVTVFRNEDTGWIWPPYFKYDSSNLQAEASNLKSDKAAPQWVMVTYYGWRLPILSIYPNAIRMRPVDSPDATVFPWVNILILTVVALVLFTIRRMWLQFRERTIDPMIEDVGEAFDTVDAQADDAARRARGLWGRVRAWLDTWKGKPNR